MDKERQTRLLEVLIQRRDSLAADWYQQLMQTSYVALSGDELRQRLTALVEQSMFTLLSEPFDGESAESIGAELANLHFIKPAALSITVGLFGRGLFAGLPPDDVLALQPSLIGLLQGVSTGFAKQSCVVVLEEQEAVRAALVAELEERRLALERARGELEGAVARRTSQLQQANEGLREEMERRRSVEDALRESEQKYRHLVENVYDVAFSIDAKGILTYISPAAELMLGIKLEEAIGQPALSSVRFTDLDLMDSRMDAIRQGEISENEYRIMVDGEVRWFRGSSRPHIVDDEVVEIYGVLTDISRRKKAEDALRQSEERLRLLLSESPDVVLTVDREGTIDYLNRVPKIAGEARADVLGKPATDYAAPGYKEVIQEAIQDAFRVGESGYYEAQTLTPEGTLLWYGTQMVPILSQGEVESVMMISRDITQRKELDEIKDQLIRDVSHELRTPLAKMQMSMELLLELASEQGAGRSLMRLGTRTLHNVQRLLRTVEAILDLSTLEAGVQRYELEALSLEDLLEDVVSDMEPLAWAGGLELLLQVEQDLEPVEGDDEKLYRVMVNLIDNAVKFSKEGQIQVAARAFPGEIEVAVTDTGQGIIRENLDRVFERFYQEKPRFHGVGVGLSICKTIVEAHGGRIWAESPGRGGGSTFRFSLPLVNREEEQGGDSANSDS